MPQSEIERIQEIWRPIKNYEGYYEVSNYGRIRSLTRKVKIQFKKRKPIYRTLHDQIIKLFCKNRRNVNSVILHNKQQKRLIVHRLVAFAFIPNPYNKPFVNHRDCNASNNYIGNLEWVTVSENTIHACRHLRKKNCKACKKSYQPHSNISKYCLDCAPRPRERLGYVEKQNRKNIIRRD